MATDQGMIFVAIVTGCICLYSLVARKVSQVDISSAMVFITIGIITAIVRDYAFDRQVWVSFPREGVLILAETTLSMVLFHDIGGIQFSALQPNLPSRVLLIGLLLCVLLTYFVVRGVLPGVGIGGALFLAGSLSCTDAALCAPTILNPAIPSLIRQALNVESGLNDGIVTPVVLIGLEIMKAGSVDLEDGVVTKHIVIPFFTAIGIGLVLGPLLAVLLDTAEKLHFANKEGKSMAIAVLPIFLVGLCKATGAMVFLAAAVAGAGFAYFCRTHHEDTELSELLEVTSDFLGNVVWYLAGQFLIAAFWVTFRWQWVVIAFMALVPLRMITVLISLLGSGLTWREQAFIAWFGPRGMATIVFVLVAIEELPLPTGDDDNPSNRPRLDTDLVGAALFTVLVSVFAHGLTAIPLADYLARHAHKRSVEAPEHESARQVRWNPSSARIRTRRPRGTRLASSNHYTLATNTTTPVTGRPDANV